MNNFHETIKTAQPMKDFDGNNIPGSGIVKRMMGLPYVHGLTMYAETSANFLYRDTGKHTVWNFTEGYTSYAIKVEITRSKRRMVQITFQDNNPCNYLTASDLWEGSL